MRKTLRSSTKAVAIMLVMLLFSSANASSAAEPSAAERLARNLENARADPDRDTWAAGTKVEYYSNEVWLPVLIKRVNPVRPGKHSSRDSLLLHYTFYPINDRDVKVWVSRGSTKLRSFTDPDEDEIPYLIKDLLEKWPVGTKLHYKGRSMDKWQVVTVIGQSGSRKGFLKVKLANGGYQSVTDPPNELKPVDPRQDSIRVSNRSGTKEKPIGSKKLFPTQLRRLAEDQRQVVYPFLFLLPILVIMFILMRKFTRRKERTEKSTTPLREVVVQSMSQRRRKNPIQERLSQA